MNCITYSLTLDQDNSDEYYDKVKDISSIVKEKFLFGGNDYLNDFMQFIVSENLEILRSKEEYGLELLLIGVLFEEYIDNIRNLKFFTGEIFIILNKLREKYGKYQFIVNEAREKLATSILMRKKHINKDISMEDFILLIKWLEASGDFKEEIIRFKNWKLFLDNKGKYYANDMLIYCKILSSQFYDISKIHLGKYISCVNNHLEKCKESHKNNEDILYCGKGEIQYLFNMISGEILNGVYRYSFLLSKEKVAFLSSCIGKINKDCLSIKYKNGLELFALPHNINLNSSDYENSGAINITCVVNIYSDELKFIRLKLIPQYLLLDNCGCNNHFCRENIMTNINITKLNSIL
ncbi:MAG: hypothetical protein RRZ84_05280 [Romboutsia sp.]